jgi:hypothetical protein
MKKRFFFVLFFKILLGCVVYYVTNSKLACLIVVEGVINLLLVNEHLAYYHPSYVRENYPFFRALFLSMGLMPFGYFFILFYPPKNRTDVPWASPMEYRVRKVGGHIHLNWCRITFTEKGMESTTPFHTLGFDLPRKGLMLVAHRKDGVVYNLYLMDKEGGRHE